ncbi:glycolipid 2-alpha-mannosyltransferase [Paraphysoderma sedebokerense]|nr:glycolipid 2-alpha-mannosyltransferase [Paraphysoderma sedebokerense]
MARKIRRLAFLSILGLLGCLALQLSATANNRYVYQTPPTPPQESKPITNVASTTPANTTHLFFPNDPEHTLPGKVKAAIVVLVRNEDLNEIVKTLTQFETRFNSRYKYPYVFLNDKVFTEEFKAKTRQVVSGEAKYGFVPYEQWGYPDWVDQDKAKSCREDYERRKVYYGGSESYRHMCRFYSGFFYRHELLKEYDWYWRIEPGVEYYCNLSYDPFSYMATHNKIYGFTMSLHELNNTIPTLWKTTRRFMTEHKELIPSENALKFIWRETDGNYNLCHFWSNFEIGDLRFFRTSQYEKFFNYLDKTGNFFYERWGDAPVHSMAAAMFLKPEQLHFFEDIGYRHDPFGHCPTSLEQQVRNDCDCNPEDTFDWHKSSCIRDWFRTVKDSKKKRYIDWQSYPQWAVDS